MRGKGLKNTAILSAASVVFLLVVWGIAYFAIGNQYLLPSPWETLKAAVSLLGTGGFYAAFFSTIGRAVVAFLLALIFGVGLALVAYLYPAFGGILRIPVAILRSMPTMAVLLLILVGVSPTIAPIVIGVLTLFPLLYTSAHSALLAVDKELLEMCDVYRVPTAVRIQKMYLPCALPKLRSEGLAALSFALKLTVSAEVLTFTYQSVGGWIQESALAVETSTMMALTLLVCLVGGVIETVGALAFRREV